MVQNTDSPGASTSAFRHPFTANQPLPPTMTPNVLLAELRHELGVNVGGSGPQVWTRDEDGFKASAIIFNGAVKTLAEILVQPESATDVSKVVKFCRKHNLGMSVKAAGTGVHGWSVAGLVILDLGRMCDVSVALPTASAPTLQESFERLRLGTSQSPPPPTEAYTVYKRPSLEEKKRSSESVTGSTKRGASDAWNDSESSRGKRRAGEDVHMSERSGGSSRRGSDEDAIGSGSGSSSSERHSRSTGVTSSGSGDNMVYTRPAISTSPSAISTEWNRTNPAPNSPYNGNYNRSFFSSPMPSAIHDPPAYTIATFGAGTHSKQLDAATASSPYGAYHVPTSAFPVGSGQFISGGFGFLGRKHGMAMDNIVEAEVVLADGRIVWVGEDGKHGGEWKEDEDPREVWWGLRGAGAILGVVTRFRAKAYYLPTVYAGNFIYVFDRASSPSLLRHVRECITSASRSVYANIILTAGPPGAPAIVVIQLCFSGAKSEGDEYINAISAWDGGRCLFQDFSERTFERQQVAVEDVLKGGQGRRWYVKSDMLKTLSDEVIDQTCARFHLIPDGCTWLFELTAGGAAVDVTDSCFPTSHRDCQFTVAALHQWPHSEAATVEQDRTCVRTAENWINEVIHANSPGGPLPCFLQSAEEADVSAVYGTNYPRLRTLKRKMDPSSFFKHAMWPRPDAPGHDRQLGLDDTTGKARNIDLLCDGFVPSEETGYAEKGFSHGGAEGNVSQKAKEGFEKFDELAAVRPGEEGPIPTPMEIKKVAEKKGMEGLLKAQAELR